MNDALEFLRGIGHTSTDCSTFFDKAARLIAGPDSCLAIAASFFCQSWLSLFAKLSSSLFFSSSWQQLVEMAGFEPATFALQRRCSPAELHPQASLLVGLTGFEPVTPALSAQCSNQLSYKPEELYSLNN